MRAWQGECPSRCLPSPAPSPPASSSPPSHPSPPGAVLWGTSPRTKASLLPGKAHWSWMQSTLIWLSVQALSSVPCTRHRAWPIVHACTLSRFNRVQLLSHVQVSMDVRAGLQRKLSAEELMLLNCGAGEDFWESLELGDPTSPS